MDPYDAGPDALNDNVNADDRDDDRFLRGDGICTWGVKALPQARVGRYLTGERVGRRRAESGGRGKGREGGKRGRMGRLGQDKKWRGGAVLGGGHLGWVVGIRWGGWGAQRWVLGAGA